MPRISRNKFFGLNLADQPFAIDAQGFHEATLAENVNLRNGGGIVCRNGRTTQFDLYEDTYWAGLPFVPTLERAHSLNFFKDASGVERLIAGLGNSIFTAESAVTPTLSKTLTTGGLRAVAAAMNGFYIQVDGTNDNLKFDGTTWTSLGLTPPSAKPQVSIGTSGLLSGDFQYVYNYVFEVVLPDGATYMAESAASEYAEVLALTSDCVSISCLANANATHTRIYRRSSNSAEYKLLYEHTDASAFSYKDNNDDSTFTGAPLVGQFEGAPPVLDGVVFWKDRLWGWKGSKLYYTMLARPEKFYLEASDFLPINIDPTNGRSIVSCVPMYNCLVVGTEDSITSIVGSEPPFTVVPINESIGFAARRSAIVCAGELWFLSKGGVYSYVEGGKLTYRSDKIDQDFSEDGAGLMDIPMSYLQYACATYSSKEKRYCLSVPNGNYTYNGKCFVFHFDVENDKVSCWTNYTFGFDDAAKTDEDTIYSVSGSTVRKEFNPDARTDDGTAIAGRYITRQYDLDGSNFDKRLVNIAPSAYCEGSATIDIFTNVFMSGDVYTDRITLTASGYYLWENDTVTTDAANSLYDNATFAPVSNANRFIPYPQECVGYSISFEFVLNGYSSLHKFDLEYTKEPRLYV